MKWKDSTLFDILYLIEDNLGDLSKWSVYHDDKCLDEIGELQEKFAELKALLDVEEEEINEN